MSTFGRLDYLVNVAGANPAYGPLMELDRAAARKTFEVNCLAALSWTQLAYHGWMSAHGGSIVNISSIASSQSVTGVGFYAASKAMLNYLTRQLACELAPSVRVNAVAPGIVKTKFSAALYDGREDAVASAYPLRRLGTPADVANAVAFLLSDDASWITGQIVAADGGALVGTRR